MKLLSEARLSQRSGFTLTEVLMAMFVMAIGMISLLALFPVGFLNARWALDAEQVSRGAANAQAMTEMPRTAVTTVGGIPVVSQTMQSVRNDDTYHPEGSNQNMIWRTCLLPPYDVTGPARFNATIGRDSFLKHSGGTWTFWWNVNAIPPFEAPGMPAGSKIKLPPVFVDPFVAQNPLMIDVNTGIPFHVGANKKDDPQPSPTMTPFASFRSPAPSGLLMQPNLLAITNPALRPPGSIGLPRTSLSQYTRELNAAVPFTSVKLRLQTENSLGDEIDFATNGQPNVVAGQFGAQRRFTWGYLCHWYDYNMANVCDVTAVLFNSRPDAPSQFPVGEENFSGFPSTSLFAGLEPAGPTNFGRMFVKGVNQAVVKLSSAVPMNAKAGDWILDNTFVLPEFDPVHPSETAPFLDVITPVRVAYPDGVGGFRFYRPGLCGGHFYKILDISPVQDAGGGTFFQTITLDRPARSDGFTACLMQGVADVIVKGVGKLPQR